jgi:hypothetical protein
LNDVLSLTAILVNFGAGIGIAVAQAVIIVTNPNSAAIHQLGFADAFARGG